MEFLVVQEVEDAPQGADDGLHFLSHHALPAASCACVSITCKVKERTVEDVRSFCFCLMSSDAKSILGTIRGHRRFACFIYLLTIRGENMKQVFV